MKARQTREVRIGNVTIGANYPIAVQSMTATKTQDIAATIRQVELLEAAGADVIRIAIDTPKDVTALAEVRAARPNANLVIDLQENYRLAERVAPFVQKLRYNPGHLYHIERDKPVSEKVAYLVDVARAHGCAIRIGVNAGSVDPEKLDKYPKHDSISPMLDSALEHCLMLDDLGFNQYVVSLKDSDPNKVIDANIRFAEARPDVPLHLGVTEAGMPPDGIIKTRVAFEQLITRGIGDTLRVSLTLPFENKGDEITVGRQILKDIASGRFRSVARFEQKGMNIISCPSCSRVENEAFIDLAQNVREMTTYAKEHDITIAVMGCRVNGPGETDDADLGMWCAPTYVNLKRGPESLGHYTYDEILGRLRVELDKLIDEKRGVLV
ncbi:MAG: (E)-4-hydroxy-3-methylbut-2-enyl-diphosphate synthase [Acidobacteria bacterium]|nr:(E)-4-hydroxy-3-methylbut-2-enyl-diphosphate synthase [Acidobacteriota bacterium]MBV9187784.1 (E)-4-hydroxy-3-methylbut-2-enyl-diphosphate synthase [Acidobacteriota bacterium]